MKATVGFALLHYINLEHNMETLKITGKFQRQYTDKNFLYIFIVVLLNKLLIKQSNLRPQATRGLYHCMLYLSVTR